MAPVPASPPSVPLAPPSASSPAAASQSSSLATSTSPLQPDRVLAMVSATSLPAAAAAAAAAPAQSPEHPHIWIVTGPAGCGKSTVAEHLAASLEIPYIEGDQYHPPANITKMSNGVPLNDEDRWDWLTKLREEAVKQLGSGRHRGVVVTCSALKRKYRDVIRVAPYFQPSVQLRFIYLSATEEALLKRVAARENHYMGANMVRSQFEALEPPTQDESDVISIDVSQPLDAVKAAAEKSVRAIMEPSP